MVPARILKEDSRPIFILLAVFLFLRLPMLLYTPMMNDDSVYAIMIEEQREGLTLIPTFLGYPVSWKPMLFFWLNASLPTLPGPLELTYRIPTFIFAMATIVPLYLLLRNAGCSKAVAFISMLVFQLTYITSYPNTMGIIDSMLFFQISLSLLIYSEESLGSRRFIAAGILAFTAYLTKTAVAAMIPVLAIAYFLFLGRRKTLYNPLFLLSLLAVPLAAILIYLIFQSSALGEEFYVLYVFNQLVSPHGLIGQAQRIWSGLWVLLLVAGAWFLLSLVGFARHWKENRFMAVWYILLLFPLLGTYFIPWYFLPVMPAVSYFAALALLREGKKEKMDAFFTIFFAFLIILAVVSSVAVREIDRAEMAPKKEAGLLLAGKDNVLFVGTWNPTTIAYKTVEEIRSTGKANDFGWVLFANNSDPGAYYDFIDDYNTDKYEVIQGSFSSAYAVKAIFRKDAAIEKFDYVVATGLENISLPDTELLYNKSGILIFKMDG